MQEYDIVDIIGEGVFGDEWRQSQVQLEVSDIIFSGENQLAALVGYTENQSASSTAARKERSYGVALLDLGGRSGSITISRFIDVAYKPVRVTRASSAWSVLTSPRTHRSLRVSRDCYFLLAAR